MKETTRRLVIAAVLLVAAVGVVAAAVSTTSVTQNSDGAVLQAGDSGPAVNITGNIDVYPATGTTGTTTVQWNTTDGNVTVTSSAHTNITIADTEIVGTWTNATAIDATNGPVTIDPADKPAVTVDEQIDTIAFRSSTSADDGVVDFVYSGSSSTSNVTLRTAPANTQLGAVDADTGALLDVATSDASGTIVFDALDNSQHNVLLQTSDSPSLSNPSPQGQLVNNPTSISVQVNDSDFPGDTVSTSFDLDGSSVGSKSVSSNGTASVSMPSRGQTAGVHTVDVTATDSFGQTTTLSYTYEVPSNITIFNETSPSQKITSATATLRFFEVGGGEVFERTTSNGKLDLTGLPVQKDMTVVVEASGFETRRIFLDSIYEQSEVYLLDTSFMNAPATGDVVFTLSDRTGQFPDSTTTLRVQRALTKDFDGDGNDETRMQTIAGDKFGASGEFPATLVASSVRYRLVIENEQGDRRVLGAYTATGDDSVTLESVPSNVTYEVRHHANRSGAADVGGLQRVGDIPPIAGALGLDPRVLAMASYVSIAAITGLVVVFDDRLAAVTGTVMAFVLTLLGTVSIPPLAIGISGAISILYAVGRVR